MKNKITHFGCTLGLLLAMIACDPSVIDTVVDPKEPFGDHFSTSDSIQLGEDYIFPLSASMTHLPVEDIKVEGKTYYCFLLKVEKIYPIDLSYLTVGPPLNSLSYSINFKLYTDRKEGPFNGTWKVKPLEDVVSYFNILDPLYASEKKTAAYLFGDRTFDVKMDAAKYLEYQRSQVRIQSGTIHLKKAPESYLISFDGLTETGEKVSLRYNGKLKLEVENQQQGLDNGFTTVMPGNYIQKGDRYYKLDPGFYLIYPPAIYEGKPIQTVKVNNWKYYYRYEEKDGLFKQQWKSNGVLLQFQFSDANQFQARNYQVAPSEGIYSMNYAFGASADIPFEGFPNDSLVIGYYHVDTDTPITLTYDEDLAYMEKQIALKSGQLEVTVHSSGYVFMGTFIDAKGEEVKMRFKAVDTPLEFRY